MIPKVVLRAGSAMLSQPSHGVPGGTAPPQPARAAVLGRQLS